MKKIFISHSSTNRFDEDNQPTQAARILEAIRGQLEETYDVFVDEERIPLGDKWRDRVYPALCTCQAAIILLDQNALTSSAVREEVAILIARRYMSVSGQPYILPVIVGEISSEKIDEAGFAALSTRQFVRPKKAKGYTTEENVAWTIKMVRSAFAKLPRADVKRDAWIAKICPRLIGTEPSVREASGKELGLEGKDLSEVTAPFGGEYMLAHRMLDRGGTLELAMAVDELKHRGIGRDKVTDLTIYLRPSWVDLEATKQVLPPKQHSDPYMVSLNAADERIGYDYVHAASCFRGDVVIGTASEITGENSEDDILYALECRLGQIALGLPRPLRDNVRLRQKRTYVLILPTAEVRLISAVNAARRLQLRFPKVVVFILTDTHDTQDIDLIKLRRLTPEKQESALTFATELSQIAETA